MILVTRGTGVIGSALLRFRTAHWLLSAAAMLLAPSSVGAQSALAPPVAPQAKPADQAEPRPTGLPAHINWTFNLDAGWGTFGFNNSYYNDPKEPGLPEDLSDQWLEGYVKPALSGVFTLKSSSEIYGKVSGVGERTYAGSLEPYGPDVSSFGVDDLAIGWRSGTRFKKAGENAVDFSVGRVPYQLGQGMLLYDGAAEGGSRGGYWTNARRAFQFGAVGRFKPGPHTIEVFYLNRDELPESDTGTRLWGFNYQFAHGESTTLGASYMRGIAKADLRPDRDGLNIFNLRADTAPLPDVPDLSFEFEYASERNGGARDSNAWTLKSAYEFGQVAWKPKLSYRYASFQGDDPATPANEAFDPLFPGFADWGSWWQGEIAGEYFLSNSNLISHQVRAHFTASDSVGTGVIVYDFRLDQPASYGPMVTDTHVAVETDIYVDWKANSNFSISIVGAFANPGRAVEQLTGRTKNFSYGMAYVAYSF
jgi:Alginate export